MRSPQTSRPEVVTESPLFVPARPTCLRWLYLLAALPVVTDLIETGALPLSGRSWITESLVGLVIVLLVHHVRRVYHDVLALAGTDQLTGLHNRRAFTESAAASCACVRRTHQPLSLVYIDLDNFKQINDRYGHAAGDRVLQQIAIAMHEVLRARIDRGFRLGGDEFAILLPGSSATHAVGVLKRLRDHCMRADRVWREGELDISYGIVEYDLREATESFIRRADEAMYRAKRLRKGASCELLTVP